MTQKIVEIVPRRTVVELLHGALELSAVFVEDPPKDLRLEQIFDQLRQVLELLGMPHPDLS